MSKKGKGKFVLGAMVGAGLGLLFAKKTGEETRKDLKIKLDELLQKAKEVDIDEVKANIEKKVNDIQKELKDLDKEKALDIAKKKSKELLAKADELLDYAVEKGTPVLEKAAAEVKEKAIVVTKEVLKRLEKES